MSVYSGPHVSMSGCVFYFDPFNARSVVSEVSASDLSPTKAQCAVSNSAGARITNGQLELSGTPQGILTGTAVLFPQTIIAVVRNFIPFQTTQIVYGCIANGNDNWISIVSGKVNNVFSLASNLSTTFLTGSTTLTTNTIYHIAATISGSDAEVFVNGIIDGQMTVPWTIAIMNNKPTIGARGGGGGFHLSGSIYYVQVYDRKLSQDEIYENYQAIRGRYRI